MIRAGIAKLKLALALSVLCSVVGCEARDQERLPEANPKLDCFTSDSVQKRVSSRWSELQKQGLTSGPTGQVGCNEWRDRALIVAVELLSVEDGAGAKEVLDSISFSSGEKEAERLFYLYMIAKFNGNRLEMTGIANRVGSAGGRDPYSHLVKGIEACLMDQCGSAVSDLESANEQLDFPVARGYLAASYAHSGRLSEAELVIDEIAPQMDQLDEYVFYMGVAVYAQRGRIADARDLARRYFAANPDLNDSPFLAEARRLIGIN